MINTSRNPYEKPQSVAKKQVESRIKAGEYFILTLSSTSMRLRNIHIDPNK